MKVHLDFGFEEAVAPFADRFFGHQQVTDIYLLALALRRKGTLATLEWSYEGQALACKAVAPGI